MKNKYVKYILIVIVVLIWGKIIISYFGLFKNSEGFVYIPEEVIIPINNIETFKEYKLSLDYSDPFLTQNKAFIKDKKGKVNDGIKTIKTTPVSVKIKDPKVIYKGLVKNKNSAKKTGLIIIDGKSHLVSINNEFSSITIISFNENECKYIFNGVVNTISK